MFAPHKGRTFEFSGFARFLRGVRWNDWFGVFRAPTLERKRNMEPKNTKPLGGKNYGSIAHLPGSRMGPGDHSCPVGQERICNEKARDKLDLIVVQ